MDHGDDQLLKLLKALAHPLRLKMVRALADGGERSCGGLGDQLPLSQPAVSHHLKILADAGLLKVRNEGQHHFVSIDHEALAKISRLLPAKKRARR